MASSPPPYIKGQETPIFRPAVRRRTPSFSSSSRSHSWDSSSSSFSFNEEFPPYSTPSPPLKFNGIPFSWEQIPGIPKQQNLKKKKKTSAAHLLPPPPAGNSSSAAKKTNKLEEISPKKYQRRDPFFAALVECSKDDHANNIGPNFGNIIWKGSSKITRSLSDRFGLMNMHGASCKRTCTVAESLVYVPRSSPHYLLHRRSN